MKLKSVDIKNFLAIISASIALDNRGLVLIQGENKIDDSATSNGAGKSSIVDAIFWCLFGETARGESTDNLVNRTAKKDAQVQVSITDDDGSEYTIIRGRKPNKLTLLKGGADISYGTEKETQALIVKIIGCSANVFAAAVYAGQEVMPNLPGMTDKQLKLLIEEAAGTEVLADAYKRANEEWLSASRNVSLIEAKTREINGTIAILDGNIRQLEDSHSKWELTKKENLEALAENIAKQAAEARTFAAAIPPESETAGRIEEIKTALAAVQGEKTALAALETADAAASRRAVNAASAAQTAKNNLLSAEHQLSHVGTRVGTPCGECHRTYRAEDLEGARVAATQRVAEAQEKVSAAMQALAVTKDEWKETTAAVASFKERMSDVSALSAELIVLNQKNSERAQAVASVNSMVANIKALQTQQSAAQAATNPIDAPLKQNRDALELKRMTLCEAEEQLANAEKYEKVAKSATLVFGPGGVRAHILDTVTPYLNKQTAEYLGAISDGHISAIWATLSKTAKGELREKFNIEVSHVHGGDTFKSLSGGEKRKVRLACFMALQDLVATRATKPINLFIADEIDTALDPAGLERLMTILETKARQRGTVFVISHNSLRDWIDSVLLVTKDANGSTVSDEA